MGSGEVAPINIYLDEDERTLAEGGGDVRHGCPALARTFRPAPQGFPRPVDGQQDVRAAPHGNPEVYRRVERDEINLVD